MHEQDKRTMEKCLYMVHPPDEEEIEILSLRKSAACEAHRQGVRDGLWIAGAIAILAALIFL